MFLTILTPTYNRKKLLSEVYLSLKAQTNNNFEWLIIDDGSTDGTSETVNKFLKQQNNFKIKYFYEKNGGKHRALNLGVKKATGKYTLILDSDDELKNDAVRKIVGWTKDIDQDKHFAGVAGLKIHRNGKIIGEFPKKQNYVDCTSLERRKNKLLGDKAEVFKTNILRKYPFPEFEGENFMPENIVWDKIAADGYKIRWYGYPIYIADYLNDGLTKNWIKKCNDNFRGFTLCTKQEIKLHSFIDKVGAIYFYDKIAKEKGLTLREEAKELDIFVFFVVISIVLVNLKKKF